MTKFKAGFAIPKTINGAQIVCYDFMSSPCDATKDLKYAGRSETIKGVTDLLWSLVVYYSCLDDKEIGRHLVKVMVVTLNKLKVVLGLRACYRRKIFENMVPPHWKFESF